MLEITLTFIKTLSRLLSFDRTDIKEKKKKKNSKTRQGFTWPVKKIYVKEFRFW